jgi:hypothetical protein
MAFNWFNAKEATLEGIKLANDLSTALEKVKNKHSKKEITGHTKAMQKLFSHFDQFEQKNNLNFYKKSKLINEFRWRLIENGHDKEFVEFVTKELTLYINK